MFQPHFVLLAGGSGAAATRLPDGNLQPADLELRVATVGFIGEPAVGDRPDRKATPFALRLLSGNLLDAGCPESISYAVSRTTAVNMEDEMDKDIGRMAAAVESGDFSGVLELVAPERKEQEEKEKDEEEDYDDLITIVPAKK